MVFVKASQTSRAKASQGTNMGTYGFEICLLDFFLKFVKNCYWEFIWVSRFVRDVSGKCVGIWYLDVGLGCNICIKLSNIGLGIESWFCIWGLSFRLGFRYINFFLVWFDTFITLFFFTLDFKFPLRALRALRALVSSWENSRLQAAVSRIPRIAVL